MIVFLGSGMDFAKSICEDDSCITLNGVAVSFTVGFRYDNKQYKFPLIVKYHADHVSWVEGRHPHISSGGSICLGTARDDIESLLRLREVGAAHGLFKTTFSKYNSESPYVGIANFDPDVTECYSCGSVVPRVYSCSKTGNNICQKCRESARRSIALHFLERCDVCKEPKLGGSFHKNSLAFKCIACRRKEKAAQ